MTTQEPTRRMNAPSTLRLAAAPDQHSERANARRRPLGQILVAQGRITAEEKLLALEAQTRQDRKLGETLVSLGFLSEPGLSQALASQFDTAVADLRAIPPDISLVQHFGLDRVLETGHLPWRRGAHGIEIASARPDMFEAARPVLERAFGPVEMLVTSEAELHRAIIERNPAGIVARAETRVPLDDSCRGWQHRFGIWLFSIAICLGFAALLAPVALFYTLLAWTLATLILQTSVKTMAWLSHLREPPNTAPSPMVARLPVVSMLVALYQEKEIAAHLVARLKAIDYPAELLDICLLVESDDALTQAALSEAELPANFRQLIVPDGSLKTKPRALNFGLEFCRGSIVGVYDAEDAPEPDQIRRVAQRFYEAPSEVVCLQGVLDYYNPHQNWVARCFTIEYATWWRVILPGYIRLGLAIPLGGTTLFFRRPALETLGGWDAHNVTEDADLGIRLARHGYRTELLDTVTYEEANCRVWPWVKQRSRWLKGYAMTWAVHSRNLPQLWRDLGPWRFFGVQLLLLGTLTQFVVAPVLWSFWLLLLGFGHIVHHDLGGGLVWGIAGVFIASELLSIAVRLHAIRLSGHKRLKRWAPTVYFYFPLATLAAYKGLIELITRPFYWDKTSHGTFTKGVEASPPPRGRHQA